MAGNVNIYTDQGGNARVYTGSATLTMGSSTTLTNSGTVTLSGTISAGSMTLSGTNTFTGATPLVFATAATTRAIDIQITPTSADRQLYMDIDYGSNAKEAAYIISSSAKTSGETTALRARGQGKAVGASTAEIRGVHAQGIAFEALYAGTVNAIYAEAIAKGTSTVTTIRGAMIACDSEGTPTAITSMYGAHVRVKTSVAPTNFYGLIVESEKFGSGVLADAAIQVKDTTWGAAETPFTVGLDFNTTGIITTGIYFNAPVATGIKFDNAGTTRAIDIQVTPTSADRQLYMDIDFASNAKEAAYVISSSASTTGEISAIRARGQAKATGASTAEVRGVHAQGIAFAALYAGTVNALYAEAIAKGTSTVTTIRGAMIACDSENTPTSIGTMMGAHIRVKTSVAPGTAYYATRIENEKFGTGKPVDSMLDFKTTTFAGGETVATDVIDLTNFVGTVTNVINYSTTTATSFLYSDATVTNFLETSADSKGGAGATRGTPNQTATCDGSITVKIGSKTLLVPLYNAVTIA